MVHRRGNRCFPTTALDIIDEISLWDLLELTYKNYTNSYALLRKKVGDDIPIIFGNYIKDNLYV